MSETGSGANPLEAITGMSDQLGGLAEGLGGLMNNPELDKTKGALEKLKQDIDKIKKLDDSFAIGKNLSEIKKAFFQDLGELGIKKDQYVENWEKVEGYIKQEIEDYLKDKRNEAVSSSIELSDMDNFVEQIAKKGDLAKRISDKQGPLQWVMKNLFGVSSISEWLAQKQADAKKKGGIEGNATAWLFGALASFFGKKAKEVEKKKEDKKETSEEVLVASEDETKIIDELNKTFQNRFAEPHDLETVRSFKLEDAKTEALKEGSYTKKIHDILTQASNTIGDVKIPLSTLIIETNSFKEPGEFIKVLKTDATAKYKLKENPAPDAEYIRKIIASAAKNRGNLEQLATDGLLEKVNTQ